MFLLGIHHLTAGLKSLAGESLRRLLQKLVGGRLSAITFGVAFTAAVQSSTAATLTTIGFVSAGLITFQQAVGVIVGATLGTTTTPWMVAFLGFRVSVSSAALPLLGVGGFLWLVAKGRLRSLGAVLAGFGLLFTGIGYLQKGMESVSWNLEGLGNGYGSLWILAGIGLVMTLVMQSSSAAAATTLVALHAGSLTFEQGCAMIVGQSVGSAATTLLVVIGGGLAVRRAAIAHIIFSVGVGLMAMLLIHPLVWLASWVGARLDDPRGVLALAAFSSIFKLAGILAFYPWLGGFTRFVERISGKGAEGPVARLDPVLAEAGGAVALEAAWRAAWELGRSAIGAVRLRLAGKPAQPFSGGLEQLRGFLESLSLETTDLSTFGPRLVRICHAMDHLGELDEELKRVPPVDGQWQAPDSFQAGANALGEWMETSGDPEAPVESGVIDAIEAASKQLHDDRKTGRDALLEDMAFRRLTAETVRAAIDSLTWADGALHHAWRFANSLRLAAYSGGHPSPPTEPRRSGPPCAQ
jgi:phosphate:Na+ symporter